MEIQTIFKTEIEKEVMRNEILRLKILFVIFLFTSFLFYYIGFRNREIIEMILSKEVHPLLPGLFFLCISSYFLVLVFALRIREKKSKPIISFARYLNAFIEVSLPSIAFFVLCEFRKPYSIYAMLTPPLLTYFIFIIASGFRLDFKISVFTGLVASIEYFTLSIYYFQLGFPDTPVSFLVILPSFLARSLMLLVSGILIAYLTSQMQTRLLKNFSLVYEKEKITNIFGKHVSPEVAEKLISGEDISESRFICVLFLDIRNFTSFSETHSPNQVVEFLNEIFQICLKIIESNQGIVNKFLGDGFMAIFGAPVNTGSEVDSAIRSALDIRAQLSEIQNKQVNIGIGIHAGDAVVGNIGSENRKEYTAIGDTVNLSSRIEQLNKEYKTQILISLEALKLSTYSESAKFVDKVKVKGKERMVDIYTL